MAFQTNLIDGGFDRFQTALESRFKGMGYSYNYGNIDATKYLEVKFHRDETTAEIVYYKTGMMEFDFYNPDTSISETFKGITDDEFHTLLGYIYAYLRDGSFEMHQKWYDDLKNYKSV